MKICTILFLISIGFFATEIHAAEDYISHAKFQEKGKQRVIAPYKTDVARLVEVVLEQQKYPNIEEFKKKLKESNKDNPIVQFTDHKKDPTTLIFVSFSMPHESLKEWISQARQHNVPIYIRGLINDSFKDTLKVMKDLVNNEDAIGGVLLDPTIFKKYKIDKVPAVIKIQEEDSYNVIYGDVTLDYAIKKLGGEKDA